jgi:hypothetical protein
VVDEAAVDRAFGELRTAGVEATEPCYYPEYAPDYYATFFSDPDGLRLEVMNFRETRRRIMYDWEARANRSKGVSTRRGVRLSLLLRAASYRAQCNSPGRCTVEYSIMICTVPHDL